MSLERFTRKHLVTAPPNESVAQVALKMRDGVGAVVIVDGQIPIGIVTDRDLTLRVLADCLSPDVPVRVVMSRSPAVVYVDESIDVAMARMRERGVRRLPIVDRERRLLGLVALDDLTVMLAGELSAAAAVVRENNGP
jgi:CBS domain-containing protein